MQNNLESEFGYKLGDWLWCLHCERCYRAIGFGQSCPYLDCDGESWDAFTWQQIRETNSDYPVVPEPNKLYGQYGK